jgi:NAD(P)H dehydrogenase (quinone)
MSLTITGASGHLATATAEKVAEIRGGTADLVLTTRRPDAIAESLRGAEVRHADFADPASLAAAFRGTTRLLLISADNIQERGRWHRAAIDAAKAAGVGHIVYTSMVAPSPANPALIADSHRATEEHLKGSGVPYTILRCALYSDFQVFEAADAIAAGEFRHNRGGGGCSYIARADCARVAAAVLAGRTAAADTGDTGSRILDVTGPQALTATDLAALYGEVGGVAIAPVEVSDEEMAAALQPAGDADPDGHAQYGAALAVSLGRAIREGFFGGVTTAVRDLTGTEPQTVAQLLEEHRPMLRNTVTHGT